MSAQGFGPHMNGFTAAMAASSNSRVPFVCSYTNSLEPCDQLAPPPPLHTHHAQPRSAA